METIIITIISLVSVILLVWEFFIYREAKKSLSDSIDYYRKRFFRRAKISFFILTALFLVQYQDFFKSNLLLRLSTLFIAMLLIFWVIILVLKDIHSVGVMALKDQQRISDESIQKLQEKISEIKNKENKTNNE